MPISLPPPGDDVVEIEYSQAGTKTIHYELEVPAPGGGQCILYASTTVDVPLVARHELKTDCGIGGYTYTLRDRSDFMPWYGNSGPLPNQPYVSWTVRSGSHAGPVVASAVGSSDYLLPPTLTPGTTYYVEQTIGLEEPNIPMMFNFICTLRTEITLAVWPTVDITYSPTSICELIPIEFSPDITPLGVPMRSYMWDFGDGAFNARANTDREYLFSGGVVNPFPYFPFLTVVDQFNCTHTSPAGLVSIFENNLSGEVTGGTEVCTGPVTLDYDPDPFSGTPTDYMWSNESVFGTNSSTDVNASGAYYVTVEDANKCRFVTHPEEVLIHDIQATGISGESDYCEGEPVILSAFSGTGIIYQWSVNGNPVPPASGGDGPRIIEYDLPPGTYVYELELVLITPNMNCTTTTAPYTVTVHANPTPPSISGIAVVDCNTYELELIGSPSGNLKWSNGVFGTNNTIFAGGPYRLWYTDAFGCVSHVDTVIPYAPESYFGWFPSGCYDICQEQMPFEIYGPTGTFDYWDWHDQASNILGSGTGTSMTPLTISGPNDYFMTLDNGICAQTTPAMNVQQIHCDCGSGAYVSSVFTCDVSTPGGYTLDLTLNSPGATFTIGLSNGPVVPFSVFLPPGTHLLNLTTTMMSAPPVNLEISYDGPTQKCYAQIPVSPTYPCSWPLERLMPTDDGQEQEEDKKTEMATGMLVYPNPAERVVKVNYHFASDQSQKRIAVYDMTGRCVGEYPAPQAHGTHSIPVEGWISGVYIVRMEENGQAIHTQKLTIQH